MNITDPIRHVARLAPTSVAVIRRDGVGVQFDRLDRLIDAAAGVLGEFAIAPGRIAGLTIAGPDAFPGLVVALGLARLGAASADMEVPAKHMDVAIVEPGQPARGDVRTLPNIAIWRRVQEAVASVPAFPSYADGAAPCRLFATSGSTGNPKFVAIGHDLMTSRVLSAMLGHGSGPAVRVCALELGISAAFTQVLRTLWSAGTLVMTGPASVLADIGPHRADALVTTPSILQQILSGLGPSEPPPPSLKLIEVTGSALPIPLYARVKQRLCENVNSWFGSTETGSIASMPLGQGDPLAVGIVHPDVEVEAMDAQGRPLPPGEEGALRIRSPSLASGYLDDAEATAAAFRDGWFYSGDIGSVSAGGLMRVVGRTGDVINSGGTKISPRLIEDVLMSVPQLSDAAAFGAPDAMGIEQIWAAVVAREPVQEAALKAFCDERLGERAPKFFLRLSALPRNANGKLRRAELAQLALAWQSAAAAGPQH